jgi:hypothetical protein
LLMPRLAWTTVLLVVLPYISGMTEACHCVQSLVKMGSHKHFAWGSILLISTSEVPRIMGLSHCTSTYKPGFHVT